MRVLYLTNNPNRASTTVPTEGWINNLSGKGLSPVIATSARGAFYQWALDSQIPTYFVSLDHPDKLRPWRFLRSLLKFRKIIRKHNIQLIHCNEHDVYPIGLRIARWFRIPIVVSLHCRVERTGCEWMFGRGRHPHRIFFLSKGSQNVCTSAITGLIPQGNWRLLYNGLDTNYYSPNANLGHKFRTEARLDGQFLIGASSWLRPGKQLEHTFQALSRLVSKETCLVLAGGVAPGEEIYAKEVLAYGQSVLGHRFRFVGCLSDLRGFYNSLDLYINTSKEETCSLSIMESLASGCPVIGYPSTSVDEQVLPGGGEIVEQDNIDQLAAALMTWKNDSAKIRAARVAARKRVEEQFDIRKIANQLWDEYHAVLAASSFNAGS